MAAEKTKFETEDLPKILAALHAAHHAQKAGKVTIQFADNGGVLAIEHESKQKFK